MYNKLPTFLTSIAAALLGLAFPLVHAYATPNLQFSPTSATLAQGSTTQINITINVDTNTTIGSDAVINYASTDLSVVSVVNGGFFPQFTSTTGTPGTIEIHGYTGPNDTRTGNGTLAVITFKALNGSGSSGISFTCTGSGTDTDIVSSGGQNILTCTQVNQAGLTYTSATATPTPTPTPTPAPGTPTPTSVPNTIPVCANISPSVTSGIGPGLAVTFGCTGVDTDGYINAAYFDFGDGTVDTITQNVGSPGTITTTHTYTTIGTVRASCKVQDNNQAWSSVPTGCQTLISINPKQITYATSQSNSQSTAPTPTPEVVSIVSETPSPTATATPTIYQPPQPTKPSLGAFWWLLGSVGAILFGALLYFLKRGSSPPIMPPSAPPGAASP